MSKYKNKYRTDSHRLRGWDYSANGNYFITLVTQHRICNLGEIVDQQMQLSDFGKIVDAEWKKSFEIRNELFCNEYIIMPNHLHAIIILKKPDDTIDSTDSPVETDGRPSLRELNEWEKNERLQQNKIRNNQPNFVRLPKSISSFIAGFKSAINSKIDDYIDENNLDIPKYNRNNHFFQPNFYDHIIRNKTEFLRIKNYIINNPKNWKTDTLKG
jgi:REP element-mobilizing transposase RayT